MSKPVKQRTIGEAISSLRSRGAKPRPTFVIEGDLTTPGLDGLGALVERLNTQFVGAPAEYAEAEGTCRAIEARLATLREGGSAIAVVSTPAPGGQHEPDPESRRKATIPTPDDRGNQPC